MIFFPLPPDQIIICSMDHVVCSPLMTPTLPSSLLSLPLMAISVSYPVLIAAQAAAAAQHQQHVVLLYHLILLFPRCYHLYYLCPTKSSNRLSRPPWWETRRSRRPLLERRRLQTCRMSAYGLWERLALWYWLYPRTASEMELVFPYSLHGSIINSLY